ncbi:MAG: 3D domain-containing protein [Verrucomicrobiota bacterium]|nr:3D domain-containing protein [Verrucomicrobiota bacterium]
MNCAASLCVLSLAGLALCGCARIQPPNRAPDFEQAFIVTGYCSCGKCCGWHRNWCLRAIDDASGRPKIVGQTASGAMARSGTVAAPPEYPFGTILYVEGYGYGRVEDRGRAIKRNRLDLWFRAHLAASWWGKKSVKVRVWLPPGKML